MKKMEEKMFKENEDTVEICGNVFYKEDLFNIFVNMMENMGYEHTTKFIDICSSMKEGFDIILKRYHKYRVYQEFGDRDLKSISEELNTYMRKANRDKSELEKYEYEVNKLKRRNDIQKLKLEENERLLADIGER